MRKKQKIAVAISGGVDSSTAAYLLKKQGYQVIGLTMQLVPCGAEKINGCCGIKAVESARRVCQKLNIPHYVLNFRKQFKEKIIDNFCQEYLQGRTPNPCVLCNQYIKFDLLLKKAREIGADFLATGHYARLRREIRNSKFENIKLLKAKDKQKDQSYFLYRLTQEQLKYVIFPLGNLTKKQVRQIARKNKLSVAERPESQEICFVPNNDYRQFLRENCPKSIKPGLILDTKGNVLGQHQGIAFYTIGQRKGLGIAAEEPLYVIKIDKKKDAIIVGREKDLYSKECLVKNVNWISGRASKLPINIKVKIRYKHPRAIAKLKTQNSKLKIIFTCHQRAITPGQSAVFYKGEQILGGGIIS